MLGPPAPPKVPAFPTPRTAISVRELPEGDEWLYEVKRDGSPDSATMTDSRMRSSGVAGVVKLDSTSLPDGPVSAQLRPEARIGRNPLKLTLARACDLSLHPAGLSRRTEPWHGSPSHARRRSRLAPASEEELVAPQKGWTRVGPSRAKALGGGAQMPVAFAPGRRT